MSLFLISFFVIAAAFAAMAVGALVGRPLLSRGCGRGLLTDGEPCAGCPPERRDSGVARSIPGARSR